MVEHLVLGSKVTLRIYYVWLPSGQRRALHFMRNELGAPHVARKYMQPCLGNETDK